MAKKIIVLSDGTGNSAAKIFKTNVWRLYQALDLSEESRQIARYDDGVGSSGYKLLAMIGGAVGWGLKRNVLDLYTFICRHHRSGDEIYAFGFSRGAFTARVLVKFILSQGIISEFYSDDDLNWKARTLYRRFRRGRKTRFGLASVGRKIRDILIAVCRFGIEERAIAIVAPSVRFVGVWDTVDAYGIPIYELKKGIDQYLWPLALEDSQFDERIGKACHAIGIDDQRTTFHPLLWDERTGPQKVELLPKSTDQEKLTQVFFAGVHANVGGGYPDDGLSFVPLNWMMKEATKENLRFKKVAVHEVERNMQLHGRLYDSRSGFAAYYRYEPRHLAPPRDNQSACIPFPKVHESVLVRMAEGTGAYAPLGLPTPARIVVEDQWMAIEEGKSGQNVFSLDEYSSMGQLKGHPKPGGTVRSAEIIESLRVPDLHFAELTWDTVWWRRICYFVTLSISIAIIVSPKYRVLSDFLVFDLTKRAFALDSLQYALSFLSGPSLEMTAEGLNVALPSLFGPWVTSFREDPSNFIGLGILLIGCLIWGSLIDRRITDRSFAAYNFFWRERRADWFRASIEWRMVASIWSAILLAGLLSFLIYLQVSPEAKCQEWGCTVGGALANAIAFASRIIVGTVLLIFFLYSIFSIVVLRRLARRRISKEPRGLSLRFAHWIRTNQSLVDLYSWLGSGVVPAMFAAGLVVVTLGLANRLSFNLFSQVGQVCVSTIKPDHDYFDGDTIIMLQFSSVCQATGLNLSAFEQYEIVVVDDKAVEESSDEQEKWLAQARALPQNSDLPSYGPLLRAAALPFQRLFAAEHFAVVARVGSKGNNETVVYAPSSVIPTSQTIKPKEDGELFLYLNHAVVGLPYLFGILYQQDGLIKVRVQQLKAS